LSDNQPLPGYDDEPPGGEIDSPVLRAAIEKAEKDDPEPKEEANGHESPEIVELRRQYEEAQAKNENLLRSIGRLQGRDDWEDVILPTMKGDSPASGDGRVEKLLARYKPEEREAVKDLIDVVRAEAEAKVRREFGGKFEDLDRTRQEVAYDRGLSEGGVSHGDRSTPEWQAFEKNYKRERAYRIVEQTDPGEAALMMARAYGSVRRSRGNTDREALLNSRSSPSFTKGGTRGGSARTVTLPREKGQLGDLKAMFEAKKRGIDDVRFDEAT
jgi:hypothetical protein